MSDRGASVHGKMPRTVDLATSRPQRGWLAVRNQTTESLVQLSADWGIAPGQVAPIVESPNGTLTLFFEPTPEQHELHAEWARADVRG